MNSRVEKDEEPNSHSLSSVSGVHSPDRSGVMVTLKHTNLLSFQEENGGVDNLVELGEVEDVGESRELLRSPDRVFRVAESVNETSETMFREPVCERSEHLRSGTEESPGAIDGEENVVSDNDSVPTLSLNAVTTVLVVREGFRNGEVDDTEDERRERVHEELICVRERDVWWLSRLGSVLEGSKEGGCTRH